MCLQHQVWEGRKIPSSKPARATQRVCESKHTEANKRCTSGLSNCSRQLFVCGPPMCEKEPLQADAAGSSRAVEFPSATHTHIPFKNDQVVGTNLQKGIADCIMKRGTVTRVLPPVPQIFHYSLLPLRRVEVPNLTSHKPELMPWSRKPLYELSSPLWLQMLGFGWPRIYAIRVDKPSKYCSWLQ